MPDIVVEIWNHHYLGALATLALAFVCAFLVEVITAGVVLRLARRTRTDLDDAIVAIVRRPLFYSVLFVGTGVATWRLQLAPRPQWAIEALLITVAVLMWVGASMRIGKLLLEALARQPGRLGFVQPRTQPLLDIVLKTVLVGGATYGVLLAWHIDVTAWLASAGIIGIAVGFAAKDTLANLFSGIFILADAPYKLGDFIILESGERGCVTDIGIRSTRIITRDDVQIILPNAAIANAKIINETGGHHELERVRIDVGVAYGSDIDRVRAVLLDVAAHSEHLVKEPEPRVRFRKLGESSLEFQLLGWIAQPVLRGRAVDGLNTAVYKRFMAEGIEIPFPQRVVHLRGATPSVPPAG
ncbi:MAG: mechanosensitive ion channel family protein [Pseudomonadota bacterium]